MTKDELAVMDGGKCIMQLRGVRPFFSNKYDITKHKRYKYLSDYDPKLVFDIEKYMSRKLFLIRRRRQNRSVHTMEKLLSGLRTALKRRF